MFAEYHRYCASSVQTPVAAKALAQMSVAQGQTRMRRAAANPRPPRPVPAPTAPGANATAAPLAVPRVPADAAPASTRTGLVAAPRILLHAECQRERQC